MTTLHESKFSNRKVYIYNRNATIYDDIRFVLHQHCQLGFYIASSLKQRVDPPGNIILNPSQPVFARPGVCFSWPGNIILNPSRPVFARPVL